MMIGLHVHAVSYQILPLRGCLEIGLSTPSMLPLGGKEDMVLIDSSEVNSVRCF
jgi:hypothetical protein